MKEELNQEEIIFRNLELRVATGYCRTSPYKSIGNIAFWIYVYSKLDIAEIIQIGDNKVTLRGKPFAEFYFDEDLKMPIFIFSNISELRWIKENQKAYLEGLKKYEPSL